MFKKFFITAGALVALAVPSAALAAQPVEIPGNGHEAAVHNSNANPNAVWGQDRSFYASEKFFGANMDIKQSFPTALGTVGEQRADWVATYGG
jgi:hypothetical protein